MRRASAAGNSNSRVRVGPQTSCCPWLRFLDLRTRREPDLAYEIACEPPSTQSEPIGLSRYRNLSLAAFKAVMPARCQQAAGPQYKSASTVRSLAEAKTQANRWNELPVLHASVHCPESIKPMIARKGQQPAISPTSPAHLLDPMDIGRIGEKHREPLRYRLLQKQQPARCQRGR